MRLFLALLLCFSVHNNLMLAATKSIPILTLADSINPGTSDYIIQNIHQADAEDAPFLILQLDTPGGLLNSTRQIVQAMLNAKTPIVVFISPKGAQAGSAGALITLAADIAAMAPGTNIGAAHPVAGGNEKIGPIMNDKITNDTAAFAESLARTKGRNTDWAKKAVRQSSSIIAEEALKSNVIDVMANDLDDLLHQLNGYRLRISKNQVSVLPSNSLATRAIPPTLKQKVVSFFADPTLSYLIMTLGGLCVWVELTHPGLVFPGIIGGLAILLSLVSFQMLPIHYGALGMILGGMGLLVAELFFPTYGAFGIGGLIAFVFGSLYLMDTSVPQFQISPLLILPTAAVLALTILGLGVLLWRTRHYKFQNGLQNLVGEFAEVKDDVTSQRGKVFLHGELWNAITLNDAPLPRGTIVTVSEVKDLLLVVKLKENS